MPDVSPTPTPTPGGTPCGIYAREALFEVSGESSVCANILNDPYHSGGPGADLRDYHALLGADNDWELIQESNCSGGFWDLEHAWSFDLGPGSTSDQLVFHLQAHIHSNSEPMDYFWSTDRVNLNYLFTVSNAEPDATFNANLPTNLSGTVWIIVKDTNSNDSSGNPNLRNQSCVNRMYIEGLVEDCAPCSGRPGESFHAVGEISACSTILENDYHSQEQGINILNYEALAESDGDYELVQETDCGEGYWDLDRMWNFNLGRSAGCGRLVFHLDGHIHPVGEPMEFFWTSDGITLHWLLTLSNTEPDRQFTAEIPPQLRGSVWIVVKDTSETDSVRNPSRRSQACLDQMFIECVGNECPNAVETLWTLYD